MVVAIYNCALCPNIVVLLCGHFLLEGTGRWGGRSQVKYKGEVKGGFLVW